MNMNISNITLSKILIINKDENHGKYKELHNIISDYDYNKYNIIIVCTQDSLSGCKTHFQRTFKKFIEEKDFTMLSKVDASRIRNRSLYSENIYNVRTRVYYKKDKVNLLFDPKKIANSYHTYGYGTTGRSEYINNRKS